MLSRRERYLASWEQAERTAIDIVKRISPRNSNWPIDLAELTSQFDGWSATFGDLEYKRYLSQESSADQWELGSNGLAPQVREAIRTASSRVREYHKTQAAKLDHESWRIPGVSGCELGQNVRALDSVCIYVPGGRAAYPSTVLMNAIPAKVAGVKEIIMVSPALGGTLNPAVIAAAIEAGVDVIYKIGGAQAISAFAYGLLKGKNKPVRRVDKIVGPGNFYVQAAKRYLFGEVDIDMVAGPSEVLIIADESANPEWLAADLLAQAEHDPMAASILITTSERLANLVGTEVQRQVKFLESRSIAEASINTYGMAIIARDMDDVLRVANDISPEHLELCVGNPDDYVDRIHNAGAIFIGHHTPEAVGDYFAGPSHVLPTGGTARFFSPLSVHDFLKRTSVIRYSEEALKRDAKHIIALAEAEGLPAHANSIKVRLNSEKG